MDGAGDIDTGFSPQAIAALQAHPRLTEACNHLARASLAHHAAMDSVGRLLLDDLGRSSLYLAAIVLDKSPDGLTATNLIAATQANRTSSTGRVTEFLRLAQDAGDLVVPSGAERWTRRRLILKPRFLERMRRNMSIQIEGARIIDPALPPPSVLADDAALAHFCFWLGALSTVHRDMVAGPWTPIEIFLSRKSGGRILARLIADQAPGRARLMEAVTISRSGLAREFGVSRAHINKMLADAQAAGALTLSGSDNVVFTEAFSDNATQTFALVIQFMRASLRAAFPGRAHAAL